MRAEVTAPPPAQKIRIKLKSYHPELLSESVEQIQQAADTTGTRLTPRRHPIRPRRHPHDCPTFSPSQDAAQRTCQASPGCELML